MNDLTELPALEPDAIYESPGLRAFSAWVAAEADRSMTERLIAQAGGQSVFTGDPWREWPDLNLPNPPEDLFRQMLL